MPRTILLADDSPTIRRLVTQTFADGGFEIIEVSNGEAAIRVLEERHPSVVLADIYMPGKNGYEVCAYIRNHPVLNATPVVLLVGAFDAFDEATARESGATANITKPFEPGALIELVTSILPPEPEPEPEPIPESVGSPSSSSSSSLHAEDLDLLGLETIFKDETLLDVPPVPGMSDDDIDRIADRVIQRLSTQVIESIAWDVVPDITEKIVREELKRIDEG